MNKTTTQRENYSQQQQWLKWQWPHLELMMTCSYIYKRVSESWNWKPNNVAKYEDLNVLIVKRFFLLDWCHSSTLGITKRSQDSTGTSQKNVTTRQCLDLWWRRVKWRNANTLVSEQIYQFWKESKKPKEQRKILTKRIHWCSSE